MKYHKIVLAGGNGYIGTKLAEHYKALTDEVIILARQPQPTDGNVKTLVWDGKNAGDWVSELENADLLVNLCGKNVNCRYTERNKQEILASRVDPTNLLNEVVLKFQHPWWNGFNFKAAGLKKSRHNGRLIVSYFLLKIGTVLQGSPYIMVLTTGINFFVMAR